MLDVLHSCLQLDILAHDLKVLRLEGGSWSAITVDYPRPVRPIIFGADSSSELNRDTASCCGSPVAGSKYSWDLEGIGVIYTSKSLPVSDSTDGER
jgi:hypothetical protein